MKSKLAVLTQSGRIYTMSASGERRYKSSKEIDKNKLELNKVIKKELSLIYFTPQDQLTVEQYFLKINSQCAGLLH